MRIDDPRIRIFPVFPLRLIAIPPRLRYATYMVYEHSWRTNLMIPCKQTNRFALRSKTMLLLMAVSLLWVTDVSAGLMLSSLETDQIQMVASCSAPIDQPLPEDSSERFLQGPSGCPSMTRSASVQGPELINAISMVECQRPRSGHR